MSEAIYIFPPMALYNIKRDMRRGMSTGNREKGLVFDGTGNPVSLPDEEELGRWIVPDQSSATLAAEFDAEIGYSNQPLANPKSGELAEGLFSLLLTSKSLRITMRKGSLRGQPGVNVNGNPRQVLALQWPLVEVDSLGTLNHGSGVWIGRERPETTFASPFIMEAGYAWTGKISLRRPKSDQFVYALIGAIASEQMNDPNDARRRRAREVLSRSSFEPELSSPSGLSFLGS